MRKAKPREIIAIMAAATKTKLGVTNHKSPRKTGKPTAAMWLIVTATGAANELYIL